MRRFLLRIGQVLGFLGLTVLPLAAATEGLPSADDVLRRIVDRAQNHVTPQLASSYQCLKQTITEELDGDGRVTERKVNVGKASAGNGSDDANKWSRGNGFSLDDQLLRRYHFTVERRVVFQGRPVLVLTFAGKQPPPPIRHFQDRLLNRAMGTVWVDEKDYDLVKADIYLGEPVSFGILGAIDAFSFAFERTPAADGTWLTLWTETFVKARKFLKFIQTRKRVDWSDFKRVDAAQPQ